MRFPQAGTADPVVVAPRASAWTVGVLSAVAIVLPGAAYGAARWALFGLAAVGAVAVFLRLAPYVGSRVARAAVSLVVAGAYLVLALAVDSAWQLLGVALGLGLAWLGVDQIFRWADRTGSGWRPALGRPSPEPPRRNDRRAEMEYYAPRDAQGDADGSFRLGLTLEKDGRRADALAAFRRADERGHAAGAGALGRMLEQAGDRAGAEAAYRRADERGHGAGATALGRMLEQAGDRAGAKAAYRRGEDRGHAAAGAALHRVLDLERPARYRPDRKVSAVRKPREMHRAREVREDRRIREDRRVRKARRVREVEVEKVDGVGEVHELTQARRALRDALEDATDVLGPSVERYLAAVHGPDWLDEANARRAAASEERAARGLETLHPFGPGDVAGDVRKAIAVIAYDPALAGHFGHRTQRDARWLHWVANTISHRPKEVDLAALHRAYGLLEEVCALARRLPHHP